MTLTFVDDADHNRYDLLVDGEQVGEIDYAIEGGRIHLTHTQVSKDRREKGLAGSFVKMVLDSLREDERDLKLVPDCPFVAHWLTENPDYNDLL